MMVHLVKMGCVKFDGVLVWCENSYKTLNCAEKEICFLIHIKFHGTRSPFYLIKPIIASFATNDQLFHLKKHFLFLLNPESMKEIILKNSFDKEMVWGSMD